MQYRTLIVPLVLCLMLAGPLFGDMTREELENFWLDYYTDNKADKADKGHWLYWQLLAQARPDECFFGIGNPNNQYDLNLMLPCPPGSQPKVNDAYIWGMTKTGSQIWYGTMSNTPCMVLGEMLGLGMMLPPIQTNSWVCEFTASQFFLPSPPFPPGYPTDWRPPRIFMYDLATMTVEEKTLQIPFSHQLLLLTTVGLRAAGSLGDLVFLTGPSMIDGVNIFAFDAASGMFLSAINLPGYNNIRNIATIDGVMYLGVSCTGGGGHVLRWTGEMPKFHNGRFLENFVTLFDFEVVGILDTDAANMALHEGRLFVTTWPNVDVITESNLAGLYMSPPIPAGGLTAAHATGWEKVWQVDDYEPDPVVARTYGGGALASFQGRLYWGTMHVPMTGFLGYLQAYGVELSTLDDALLALLGTWRNTALFVGKDFGDPDKYQHIKLAYGMPYLPAYDPHQGWSIQPNNMHEYDRHPMHGFSGFDNFFNAYTWAMSVYNNQLYIGTFDWSYMLYDVIDTVLNLKFGPVPHDALKIPTTPFGADLFRISSKTLAAKPENISGLGNPLNYGIRTMLSDEDGLFIGTANAMNLVVPYTPPAPPFKQLEPAGGWQLLRMAEIPDDLLCSGYAQPFMTYEGRTVKFHIDTDVSGSEFSEVVWSFGDGAMGMGAHVTHEYDMPGIFPWAMAVVTEGDVCFDLGYVIILPVCDPDIIIEDDYGQCVLTICSCSGKYVLTVNKDGKKSVFTGVGHFYDCHAAYSGEEEFDIRCFASSPSDPWQLDVKMDQTHSIDQGLFVHTEKGIVIHFFRSDPDGAAQ